MNSTQFERDQYIEVIDGLLRKADVHRLRLVWIFANGIIKRTEK